MSLSPGLNEISLNLTLKPGKSVPNVLSGFVGAEKVPLRYRVELSVGSGLRSFEGFVRPKLPKPRPPW